MAERVHLTVRGSIDSLELDATSGTKRTWQITLGVSLPKSTPAAQRFRRLAELARDVRRFAIIAGASSGSIATRDIELRTLVIAELERECGIFLDVASTTTRRGATS